MRIAELIMAIVLAVFSGYLMLKSAELPFMWVKGTGPGPGMFPFWLSLGMLLSMIWIIINWARKVGPVASSEDTYFVDKPTAMLLYKVIGSLAIMIGLIHFIGVYGSIPLFFIWYMRTLGDHSWKETLALALATPVVTFFFFEILLHITLPKGYLDPLFYPLYDIFM